MRLSTPLHLLSIIFIPQFSHAQVPTNPLTNPGCSTVYSIVESCISKFPDLPTLPSSVAFSCLCYQSSNYAPKVYDNAATACVDYFISAYSTTGNPFASYAAGFCTDPSFIPVATTPAVPTGTAAGGGSLSTASATTPAATATATATVNPTSASGLLASNSAASNSITAAPSSPTGQSGSGGSAGASVASASSKAEGAKIGSINEDGSLWSIFGFVFAGLFVL